MTWALPVGLALGVWGLTFSGSGTFTLLSGHMMTVRLALQLFWYRSARLLAKDPILSMATCHTMALVDVSLQGTDGASKKIQVEPGTTVKMILDNEVWELPAGYGAHLVNATAEVLETTRQIWEPQAGCDKQIKVILLINAPGCRGDFL